MEENFKNTFGFILFILIILFLAIGGFFFTRYSLDKMAKEEDAKQNEVIDYKKDKDKDFIYYINESTISEAGEIYYKDVVINLTTQEDLTLALEKENKIYKDTIKYIDENELVSKDLIKYDYDNIYSLIFREYKDYKYDKYVSLVLNDYNFSCFDDITFSKTNSYIFDITTGKVVREDEILSSFNITIDDVKEKIREYLNGKQGTENGSDIIKIDETVNELDNYAFYINNYGHLCITYLVKTTQVDYNEDMEVK